MKPCDDGQVIRAQSLYPEVGVWRAAHFPQRMTSARGRGQWRDGVTPLSPHSIRTFLRAGACASGLL
ncbi:hypothetical protein RR48_07917 [Papilio machaon]|uniref:Uncharacterized protein n=1 Tax=Papilio machaon TaxID=76193 RepID=A0A194QQ26_PAPMA|nr:hypothetical protein RR48_07917 [Papilio machaon]